MSTNVAYISLVRKGELHYTLMRGDTFAPAPVSFDIGVDPEDFSGCTFKMQVRSDAKRVMIELTETDGISVSGNILQYSIDAEDLANWSSGIYYYDIQKIDGSGIISTIISGTITLIKDQTV